MIHYTIHVEDIKNFMSDFRASFPDLNFWGAADLIAEGDYVVGRCEGGGTHTGTAFNDLLVGSVPAASGKKMHSPKKLSLKLLMEKSPKKSDWTGGTP